MDGSLLVGLSFPSKDIPPTEKELQMKSLLTAALLLACFPVFAGSCEDSFQKQGNLFKGTSYTASVDVPDASVKSVTSQMRGIAVARGMDVLSQDLDGGSLLIEAPETMAHKPLPMLISATSQANASRVTAKLKLGKGAIGSADSLRKYMCEMLAQLKSGKAGAQLADKGGTATAAPTEIDAFQLSEQLTRQADDNLAAIDARYKGKAFKVHGKSTGTSSNSDGTYNIGFGSSEPDNFSKVAITCKMARNQAAYALSLSNGETITLTGTVDHFSSGGRIFWLKDCHP